jgi:hypothetical protein
LATEARGQSGFVVCFVGVFTGTCGILFFAIGKLLGDRTIHRLTMVGTCLTVAESPEHRPVWDGQEPAEFKTDLAALKTKYQSAIRVASQAGSAITGAANAKAKAETALENAAIKLILALANHFKKTGDHRV